MKRIVILLAGATLCLAGCLSIETAQVPGADSSHHVMVRNYGKYLLDIVPVWCGNANENPKCDFVMFRNDVTMDKMNHRFYAACNKVKPGGEVSDIVCHNDHNIMLEIPIWSFNIPIPYLWTTREIQITGVVK